MVGISHYELNRKGVPMPLRLRATLAALSGSALILTVLTIAPQAAQAASTRPVFSEAFSGPTQVADCNAVGQSGHAPGHVWDTYTCLPGTGLQSGETILIGYIITG
jgi:hypothetical protein